MPEKESIVPAPFKYFLSRIHLPLSDCVKIIASNVYPEKGTSISFVSELALISTSAANNYLSL